MVRALVLLQFFKHALPVTISNIKTWYHTWRFHKGAAVKEGGRFKMSIVQDVKQYYLVSMEITSVDAADEGEYKAVAKNAHGEGVATINLNFEGSGKPK